MIYYCNRKFRFFKKNETFKKLKNKILLLINFVDILLSQDQKD